MKYNNFEELEEAYLNVAEEKGAEEALILLEEGVENLSKEEFEQNLALILLDKCCFFYECERYEDTLNILQLMLGKDFVCPLYYFDNLKRDEKFIRLKERNNMLLRIAKEKIKFQYQVYLPEGYSNGRKYPVFFNLHGDGDNTKYHKEYWKPEYLLKKGFIVVYLQSSQVLRHNSYGWIKRDIFIEEDYKDQELSVNSNKEIGTYDALYDEIKDCYDCLCKDYSIDRDKVLIGGFSGGAIGAIDITVADIIPIRGVIALCALKPRAFMEENIRKFLTKEKKWVFMDGGKDIPVQYVEEMVDICKRVGMPYKYYINEGIGHWYPEDLDDKLGKALSFILQ